ncbi:MAG: AAA family ATPase [Spiribacter salinus]|uniref:AAA family ATPase n=1 Tax=Spiribacter salinus TaxID=1335746 RepID=A0A540V9S9_9GAMM|nr:MAG: AAA family ATPase [Spiribacter salinus]
MPESDIQRIANSVARYEPGDPLTNTTAAYFEGETGGALDLSTAGVGDLLNTTPPRREWVIKDRLPHGVVGILGAAGGTGKGFATLQLAVSVATGEPWLGMGVGKEGPTLILSAEDDRDEIHRRLHRVIEHYEWADPFADSWQTANIRDEVARRVYVLDRVGEDNRLTTQVERCTTRTALADRIVEAVQGMDEPPVLIVLDPLSRFDGGDPNDNADGTRLIEAAEHIRKSTGATVLIPHHVNKASSKESAAGQEAIRGASGLVDGARWVGLMTTLRADEAKRYGVDEEEARWYARLDIVKGNYGPPWEGVWLRKLDGGVLAPTEMKATKQRDQEIKADEQYGKVLKETKRLIRKHGPMTRRHIRNNYAGTAGVFGVGEKNAMAAIERAVEAGELFESPDESSTGHLLNLAPGDE